MEATVSQKGHMANLRTTRLAPFAEWSMVPAMHENLDQVQLLAALKSLKNRDYAVRLPARLPGIGGQIADTFNQIIEHKQRLFEQSRTLAQQLESQQVELRRTIVALDNCARQMALHNAEVARKNHEVELAHRALDEKTRDLAMTSRYKCAFLTNISHELRTPLNSLLVFSEQLLRNPDAHLTPREVEFAQTIHASGHDLLVLINDILDLAKIESGTTIVDATDVSLQDMIDDIQRMFLHVATDRKLALRLQVEADVPASMLTDSRKLQQILRNLLSNAFKFTEMGSVTFRVRLAQNGWSEGHPILSRAEHVVAFAIEDTGIGIPADKQRIIFESFQQADDGIHRKYGGTGLGLTISREITRLLGGEIKLTSTPRVGSEFTLYLPLRYARHES